MSMSASDFCLQNPHASGRPSGSRSAVTSSSYRSSESSDSEEKEESHVKPKAPPVHNNSQLEVGDDVDESVQEAESFMLGCFELNPEIKLFLLEHFISDDIL